MYDNKILHYLVTWTHTAELKNTIIIKCFLLSQQFSFLRTIAQRNFSLPDFENFSYRAPVARYRSVRLKTFLENKIHWQ